MRKQFYNLPFAAGHDGARLKQGLWLRGRKTIPIFRRDVFFEFQAAVFDYHLKRAELKTAQLLEALK